MTHFIGLPGIYYFRQYLPLKIIKLYTLVYNAFMINIELLAIDTAVSFCITHTTRKGCILRELKSALQNYQVTNPQIIISEQKI